MKKDEIKVGAVLSYITIAFSNVVGIIYTPIMLRMLGQAEYGIYSLVGSIISYMSIVDLGFGNATIRYIAKYRAVGDKEKEYSVNGMFIIINTILAAIVLFIGYVLFKNLHIIFGNSLSSTEINKVKIMVFILSFNLAISFPFGVFSSIITAHERFIFPKVIGIIRTILNPIVILSVLYLGFKSIGMVIANTIINILFIWINVFYCFMILKIKVRFKNFDIDILREIMNYSFYIFIAIIVDKIYWSTDQFILGIVSGSTAIAIYSIGSQINMYYMQFSTSISGMFLPRITSMVVNKANDDELTNIFIKVGRIQYIILSLILSGFILFGREFVYIWAGEGYIQSYYIALILITPFTIPLIQNIGLSILQAKNMHKFRSKVYFWIAIGNLIISVPLAKQLGGIGSAIGTAIAMIIGNIIIINIYYYKKVNLDIIRFWKEIFRITIPILFIIVIGISLNIIFKKFGILNLIIKILIYSISYSLIMYNFAMNEYEKNILSKPFKNFIQKIYRRKVIN